ncbi:DNA-binding protein [Agrobacterium sp.]|uniref:PPC domain-containing DNA-binding protein n=1 Tax=Agrobacterium sp. TaxID=361 RepID=UPI0028A5DED4
MTSSHFSSASGQGGRVVAARIHPNRDVLQSIEEICLAHEISCGQITTTIGSLKRVALHYVSRVEPDPKLGYTTQLIMEGPFSLLTGQGLVSPSEEPGRLNIHYHAVISGENDVVYGGHIEPGTITLTTLDLFISEVQGVDIIRGRDPQTGVIVTTIQAAAA